MKTILTLIVLVLFLNVAQSQQVSLTSQYMMNKFIMNPAIAGTTSHIPVNLNVRTQWVDIEGAPKTQSLTSHAYLGKNMGLGACFFNDVTGPTRRTGMSVSTAYHLRLNQDYTRMLSFGLSGAFFQHMVNIDKLTTDEPENMSILNGFNNQFGVDANFGMYYTESDKYYVGFSVLNLFETQKDLFNVSNDVINPISRTYYLNAGYYIELSKDYGFEPSFLMQRQGNTPSQLDVNAMFTYQKMLWLGASYRIEDAVVLILALDMNDFAIGYSYDITVSEIGKYSSGSHEVNIIYRIFRKDAFNKKAGNKSFPLFN